MKRAIRRTAPKNDHLTTIHLWRSVRLGAAVQLAARVCARAEPGRILAANVVRELAMGKGFLFSDMGDVVLRGFEDPVRLYEVRGPDA
jgi:class 3 adenylate cyclase